MTTPYDELLDFAQSSDDGMDSDASIQPIAIEDIAPDVQNRPLQHLRRRTERLRAAVEPFVRQGRSLEEAKRGVTLPESYEGYAFGQFFPSNVEKVYGELKEGR